MRNRKATTEQKGNQKKSENELKPNSPMFKCCLILEIILFGGLIFLLVSTAIHQFLLFEEAVEVADYQHSLNGTFVPFNGKKLFVQCGGTLSHKPVVFLVGGLGGLLSDWTAIYNELIKSTHVCRYDPLGFGFSDALDDPTEGTPEHSIDQLRTIYNHLGMREVPKIVVGHSFGGLVTRLLTHKYHKEDHIVGAVLVDATTELILQDFIIPEIEMLTFLLDTLPWVNFFGVSRILSAFGVHPSDAELVAYLPDEQCKNVLRYFQHQASYHEAASQVANQYCKSLALVKQIIEDNPITEGDNVQIRIVSAGNVDGFLAETQGKDKHFEAREALFASYPASITKEHIVDRNSRHWIHLERPDLVIKAIKELL